MREVREPEAQYKPRRGQRLRRLLRNLLPASRGHGPLLQRDYWAVIAGCRLRPSEVVGLVADRFSDFAPAELAAFHRADAAAAPLKLGDEMMVDIRLVGTASVRVTHRQRTSITLATLCGHPEAGRITFAAYRTPDGEVIFHIRSRARASSKRSYFGFLTAGESMQTATWTDFVDRVAAAAGDGVSGFIHSETRRMRDEDDVATPSAMPTLLAHAD